MKQATIRWAVATLAMAALLTVRVCVAQGTAAPVVIKFGHVVTVDTPQGKAAQRFKELMDERSKGLIKVEIHPSASLYKDTTDDGQKLVAEENAAALAQIGRRARSRSSG